MYQTFNIFPTTVYVGEMEDHSKHKEDFYKVYSSIDLCECNLQNLTTILFLSGR